MSDSENRITQFRGAWKDYRKERQEKRQQPPSQLKMALSFGLVAACLIVGGLVSLFS